MERGFVITGVKSFEVMSPSELDRKFFGEQSMLSALSLEQLSTSRASNDTATEGCEAQPPSLYLSPGSGSPSVVTSFTRRDSHTHLTVPLSLQGKSSTPCKFLQKHKLAGALDPSDVDLAASQISWDVSLIKSESNSPKPCMESSSLESTWSPKPESA